MYKIFAGVLAFLITLTSPIIAAGQAEQTEELTSLQAAIDIALENNPAVRAAEATWQAALQEVPVAGTWPEPSLTFTQFARSVETRNGPQLQQVALNQMIPLWGTTGLKRSIALQKAQKAEQEYKAARLRVRTQVKSIWSDLYWVDASLAALREYQDLLETFREIAETRYSTGQGLQTSVLKAQVEISNLEEKILNFGEMRTTFVHNLNSALNRPIDAPVATVDTLTIPEYTLQEAALLDSLTRYRQDLQGLQSIIEANRSMVSLQKKRNFPSLGVGVNYINIGNTPLAAPDPGADALAVMAKITLPLWFKANKARVQEAKLGLAKTQYQYADKRNTAESEVRTLHFKIRQGQKSLELYNSQLIPEAEQTLNSAMAAYKTGSLGFLDLLDSERMILQFRLSYYKERATYFQHLADLEQAIGTELDIQGE